ncbi:hypothetical protein BZG36_00145 [Bifiguratus adelaidae]|uniref:Uncharacterized protein n=1 Tax=Bifiguratus adelaidae TaxID=1938954 RepID=A0A261Y897_9FUNG|nr:hypothetical protein BZG36_00145 [Bifiguratus adelaidae]
MGKWIEPAHEDELVRKFKFLFAVAKEKIQAECRDDSYTFENFVEALDENDKFVRRLFEFLIRDTCQRRSRPWTSFPNPISEDQEHSSLRSRRHSSSRLLYQRLQEDRPSPEPPHPLSESSPPVEEQTSNERTSQSRSTEQSSSREMTAHELLHRLARRHSRTVQSSAQSQIGSSTSVELAELQDYLQHVSARRPSVSAAINAANRAHLRTLEQRDRHWRDRAEFERWVESRLRRDQTNPYGMQALISASGEAPSENQDESGQ